MVQLRCCYILDTKDVTAARSISPINSSLGCGQAQAIGVGSILKCHIQLAFILSRQNSHSGSETQAVQQLDQFKTGIKKGSLMFPYDARVSLPPLSYICSSLHAKGQALRQVLRRQGLGQSLETWKNYIVVGLHLWRRCLLFGCSSYPRFWIFSAHTRDFGSFWLIPRFWIFSAHLQAKQDFRAPIL